MVNKIILVFVFVFLVGNISAIVINEVMSWPIQNDNYNEWIEIYNSGSESIDLSDYTLCGKILLAGYIDHGDLQTKNDNGMVLGAGEYSVITDGETGTEVYSNFDIDSNALAIHVDASSICSVLTNSGKEVTLEKNSSTIFSFVYSDSENGKSFSLINGVIQITDPTIGVVNLVAPIVEQDPVIETNSSVQEEINITGEFNVSVEEVQVSYVAKNKSVEESIEEESNVLVLSGNVVSDTKDIKSETTDGIQEDTKKLDKSDYIKYGLIGFGILIALLFLLKGKIRKKEYKNEFKE